MKTTNIVWGFFNTSLKLLAQGNKTSVDYEEMCYLLRTIGKVYDNRTLKNYIDCMLQNKWISEENSENPLNPNSVLTDSESPLFNYANSRANLCIYKNSTFKIDKDTTFDTVKPRDIIEEMLKRNKPT